MFVDCGSSRIGWWASVAPSWPLIKLFPQAWWKRKSSFRGDWATSTERETQHFVRTPLCSVPLLEVKQALRVWLRQMEKQLGGNTSSFPHHLCNQAIFRHTNTVYMFLYVCATQPGREKDIVLYIAHPYISLLSQKGNPVLMLSSYGIHTPVNVFFLKKCQHYR